MPIIAEFCNLTNFDNLFYKSGDSVAPSKSPPEGETLEN
jgi:hypothetical protein